VVAFEYQGGINSSAVDFISSLVRRLLVACDDRRETSFLCQRLFVAVLPFNAAILQCSFDVDSAVASCHSSFYNSFALELFTCKALK
jgi:hypothetical protein